MNYRYFANQQRWCNANAIILASVFDLNGGPKEVGVVSANDNDINRHIQKSVTIKGMSDSFCDPMNSTGIRAAIFGSAGTNLTTPNVSLELKDHIHTPIITIYRRFSVHRHRDFVGPSVTMNIILSVDGRGLPRKRLRIPGSPPRPSKLSTFGKIFQGIGCGIFLCHSLWQIILHRIIFSLKVHVAMKQETKSKNQRPDRRAESSEITDFRIFLQNELVERCKKNNAYSLRSFARFLDLDPSTLSQVLRGKRKLTEKGISKIAGRLGLGPEEVSRFKVTPTEPNGQPRPALELTLDLFRLIADWYHYAIFELITVQDFQPDTKWIARALGITVSEAHIAIERLQRLSLIEIDEEGRWKQGQDLITTVGNPFTASAFRRLQKQVLDKAITALEEMPIDVRDQTSMTMAINSARLPEIKSRIKKFRRELCDYLQQDQIRDSVYNLGVSFYPVTKKVKE